MNRSPDQILGFTLIEALVALAVLSVGLLGLAALQATATDFTNNSYYRTQASIFANAYIERMRANPGGVTAGLYGNINSGAVNCGVTPTPYCAESAATATTLVLPCNPNQLATVDVFAIACGVPTAGGAAGGMGDLLPASTLVVDCFGVVPCDNTTRHRITITWNETERGIATVKTVTMTVLP